VRGAVTVAGAGLTLAVTKTQWSLPVRQRPGGSIPTFEEFAAAEFLPFADSRFLNKPKTLEYYRNGVKSLSAFTPIATANPDSISTGDITGFISKRRKAGLKVSSINRELEFLQRMLRLALEGSILERSPLRVQMLPGENQRDRVLTNDEEAGISKPPSASVALSSPLTRRRLHSPN
jgi:site-specific recombinase XerD